MLLNIYTSFSKFLFFLSLLMGTIMAISSTTWVGACMGLELNLLMFIPLLSDHSSLNTEVSLKYFLIQVCASLLIVFTVVSLTMKSIEFFNIISFSLLLKMGVAPFHFWYPMVSEGLNWMLFYILATLQKLAPLALLFYSFTGWLQSLYFIIIIYSGLVGAVGGINEFSIRKMMAFSSINHMAWVLFPLMKNMSSCVIYFFFYCLISASVIYLFYTYSLFHYNQMLSKKLTYFPKMLLFSSLLSLGGLPPLVGFTPKWIIIQNISSDLSTLLLILLILSNIITLYFYIRLMVMVIFTQKYMTTPVMESKSKLFFYYLWLITNFTGLMILYFIFSKI